MRLGKKLVPLFMLLATWAFSQNYQFPESKRPYLAIDLSNTLPGNELHDRLHYLVIGSDGIDLPDEIQQLLENINDEPMYHGKFTFQRSIYLRVLYNEHIAPDDKKFVCNYILEHPGDVFVEVRPIFQAYLNQVRPN